MGPSAGWAKPLLALVLASIVTVAGAQTGDDRSAEPAGSAAAGLLTEANHQIEESVRARLAGDDARAGEAARRAREGAALLARDHDLPFTLRRLETVESWSADQCRSAARSWESLARVETDPVRADPDAITSILESCRERGDRWCEARALLARAESLAQATVTPAVSEAAAAAEAILREAGPSAHLARALLLQRGTGAGEGVDAAEKARGRYEEALILARQAGDASTEGRLLCETVQLDLNARRTEAARAGLDRAAAIAGRGDVPRVAACHAYVEGVSRYYGGDPARAREIWDAFAASGGAGKAPRELSWILAGSAAVSVDLADGRGAAQRARRAAELAESLNGDGDLLRPYCNLATALSFMGGGPEMERAARTCLELCRKYGRRDGESLALLRLGNVAHSDERYEEAVELYSESVSAARESNFVRQIPWSLVYLGAVLLDLGRVDESRKHLEEARALADQLGWSPTRGAVYAQLSRAMALAGETGEAERLSGEAVDLIGENGSALIRATAVRYRGFARYLRQDYGSALIDFREAFDLYGEVGNTGMQASVAVDLGNVLFMLNQHERALQSYTRARELGEEAGALEPQSVALGNIAMLKRRFGLTEEDREALARAAGELARMSPLPHRVNHLIGLSETLASLGRPEEAEEVARRAERLARQVGVAGMEADARTRLALILSQLGRHDEALAECGEVLAGGTPLPSDMRMKTEFRCGVVHERAGDPRGAIDLLDSALGLAESTRDRLTQPTLKASYIEDRAGIYAELVQAVLAAAGAEPSLQAVSEAFGVSERFRSRLLLEALMSEKRDPSGEREEEGEVGRTRRDLLVRLAELHIDTAGATGEEAGRILEEIRELEARLDELAPRRGGPPTERILGAARATIKSVQEMLPAGTAAVEYLLGRPRSFLFVITRDAAVVERIPGWEPTTEEIRIFRGLLERRGPSAERDREAIQVQGEKLYRSLLEPARHLLRDGIRRLVISPEGPLHLIPFEALVVSAEEPGGPPRYLVEESEITLVPSLSVLRGLARTPVPAHEGRSLVAFANPLSGRLAPGSDSPVATGSGMTLPAGVPPLPYSEEEVRRAAGRLGGDRSITTGAGVTEARVRQALEAGYPIVHVASHGFLDAASFGRSGLLLTADPESGEDGLLQAREVVDLRVDAGLIVLSGCSTGGGRLVWGEGLMGLPHALFQAGARSIVMSLWAVGDRAAALLMDRFYEGISRGLTVGEALRAAKLDLLRTGRPDLGHPSVWAPFVMAGISDEVLDLPPPSSGRAGRLLGLAVAALVLSIVLIGLSVWVARARS